MPRDYVSGLPAQIAFELNGITGFTVTSATTTVKDSTTGIPTGGSPFTCTITALSDADVLLSWQWPAPPKGQYQLEYNVTYSDGSQDTFPAPLLIIKEPSEFTIATYDVTTPLGLVRSYIADVDVNDPIWADDEINAYLNRNSTPEITASMLCMAEATDKARITKRIKIGSLGMDRSSVYQALLDMAERFRKIAVTPPLYNPVSQVFIPATTSSPGTMTPW